MQTRKKASACCVNVRGSPLPLFSFTLQKACCASLFPSLTLTNVHYHEDSTSCFQLHARYIRVARCPLYEYSHRRYARQAFCNVKTSVSSHESLNRIPHDHTASRAPSERGRCVTTSFSFTLQKACCAPLSSSLTLTNGHYHEDSTSCFSFMLATSM